MTIDVEAEDESIEEPQGGEDRLSMIPAWSVVLAIVGVCGGAVFVSWGDAAPQT